METIRIGQYEWQKSIGDEGQDVYVANFLIDEDEVIGQYPSEELYDIVVDKDTDFYLPSQSFSEELTEDRVAFKFRKGTFTQSEQDGALEGLYGAASVSDNRGMAAGPKSESHGNRLWVEMWQDQVLEWYAKGQPSNIDGSDPLQAILDKRDGYGIRASAWIRMTIEEKYEYETFFQEMMKELAGMGVLEASDHVKFIYDNYVSVTGYASQIWSGIAGFYDRYPRIPFGRPTAYTENHREKFEKCYPFARKLDKEFARLMPGRYGLQKKLADDTDSKFLIGEDTTFTTITVNTTTNERNARMACHRDAGSLNEGFSNLTVIGDGKKSWKGGYLVCPEVRVAINVRPGDLALVDNMRIIHGNTAIEEPDEGDLMRMSLVFYYRENMKKLGSWDYEALRRTYVKEREKNQEHPLWWSRWNGVSANMWFEDEWYDYLRNHMGEDTVKQYHPEAYEQAGSLEDFFS